MNNTLKGLQHLDRLITIREQVQAWLDTCYTFNENLYVNYLNISSYFKCREPNTIDVPHYTAPHYECMVNLIMVYRECKMFPRVLTYSQAHYDYCMDKVVQAIIQTPVEIQTPVGIQTT